MIRNSVFVGLTPQWCQICWSPQSWTRPCHPGLFVPQSRWWSGLESKSRLLIWSDPWSLLSPRMFLQPAGITVKVAFNLSGEHAHDVLPGLSEPWDIWQQIENYRLIWQWITADYIGLPALVTHSTPWLRFSNRKGLRSIKENQENQTVHTVWVSWCVYESYVNECNNVFVFFCVCVRVCARAYLMSPPHHQVGEESNPTNRAKESDGEELCWGLENNLKKEKKRDFLHKCWEQFSSQKCLKQKKRKERTQYSRTSSCSGTQQETRCPSLNHSSKQICLKLLVPSTNSSVCLFYCNHLVAHSKPPQPVCQSAQCVCVVTSLLTSGSVSHSGKTIGRMRR